MKNNNRKHKTTTTEFIYRHQIIFKIMYRLCNGVMFRKQLEKLILEFNLYQIIKNSDGTEEKRYYNKSSIRDFITRAKEENLLTTRQYLNTKNLILTISKTPIKLLYPELNYADIKSFNKDDYSYSKNEFRLFKTELFIQEYKDFFLKFDQFIALEKMNNYKFFTLYNGLSDLTIFYNAINTKYGMNDYLMENRKAYLSAIENTLKHKKKTFNSSNEKYLYEKQKKEIENGVRQKGENLFNIYSMFKKNVFYYYEPKSKKDSYIVWITNKDILRTKLQLLIRDIITFHYDVIGRKIDKNNLDIIIYTPTKLESDNLKSLWHDKTYSYKNGEQKVIHANKTFEKKYNINAFGTYNISFKHFNFDDDYREGISRSQIMKYSKEYTKADEQEQIKILENEIKEKANLEVDNMKKELTNFQNDKNTKDNYLKNLLSSDIRCIAIIAEEKDNKNELEEYLNQFKNIKSDNTELQKRTKLMITVFENLIKYGCSQCFNDDIRKMIKNHQKEGELTYINFFFRD